MAGFNIVHVHHPLAAARLLEWRHIQDFSCYFKTDNKRMHSLTSWVSEQGDNEFNVCSSEEHPRVLTGPQMEISHPALFALVGVSPVLLADWGWKNLWANPGDSRLSLLWAQRRETIPRTPRSWRETIPRHLPHLRSRSCTRAHPVHPLGSSLGGIGRARAARSRGRGGRGRERARRAATSRGRVVAEAGDEALGGCRGRGSAEGTRAMNPKAGGEEEDCVDSGAETGG